MVAITETKNNILKSTPMISNSLNMIAHHLSNIPKCRY